MSLAQNLPFYFNKSVNSSPGIPTLKTANILLAPSTGSIGGSGLNYDYCSEKPRQSTDKVFRVVWLSLISE